MTRRVYVGMYTGVPLFSCTEFNEGWRSLQMLVALYVQTPGGLTWDMDRVDLREALFYNASNSEGQSKVLADNPQAKTNLITQLRSTWE